LKRTLKRSLASVVVLGVAAVASAVLLGTGTLAVHHSAASPVTWATAESGSAAASFGLIYDHLSRTADGLVARHVLRVQ
jgi:hypothetical protein